MSEREEPLKGLAECPFCGSHNISSGEVLMSDDKGFGKQTGCDDCGALGPIVRVMDDQIIGLDASEVADAAWNRRWASEVESLRSAVQAGSGEPTKRRDAKDYAIEHAEYMAQSAEHAMLARDALDEAHYRDGDTPGGIGEELDAAQERDAEARSALASAIYEFRKRRDRAASPPSERPAQAARDFYLGGPYHDGTYSICEVATGRVRHVFNPATDDHHIEGSKYNSRGVNTSSGVAATPAAASEVQVEPLTEWPLFEATFRKPMGVEWNGSTYALPKDWERTIAADRFISQWDAWKARATHGVNQADDAAAVLPELVWLIDRMDHPTDGAFDQNDAHRDRELMARFTASLGRARAVVRGMPSSPAPADTQGNGGGE